MLTPENTDCSQVACNIVNKTLLSLDGFAALRQQMEGTTYTVEQFGADIARIIDDEIWDGEMLSLEEAERYVMEVLDEYGEHRLGVKSKIASNVLDDLYYDDRFAMVRRDGVLAKLEEVEMNYVKQ